MEEKDSSAGAEAAMEDIQVDATIFKPAASISDEQGIPPESSCNNIFVVPLTPRPLHHHPLPRAATTYKLEAYHKHALIVFNHEEPWETSSPRYGTHEDMKALDETFRLFSFEVTEHEDKTKDEIFQILEEFTSRDFTEYGCIGIAVMTHGYSNGLLAAKDRKYCELKVINHLKDATKRNRTLWAKPKLFIVQACRGTQKKLGMPGQRSMNSRIRSDVGEEQDPVEYHLPEEADLLLLHSCYDGCVSQRDPRTGTWFIQTLCKKIKELADTQDLESIFTEVRRDVAIERYAEADRSHQEVYAQIPVSMSTLTRKLFLMRSGDLHPDRKTESPPEDLESLESPDISDFHRPLIERYRCGAVSPSYSTNRIYPPGWMMQHGTEQNPAWLFRCNCYLKRFEYLKTCLKHYITDNPEDRVAENYLLIANSYEDLVPPINMSKNPKYVIIGVIKDHLKINAKRYDFYKYLNIFDDD